MSPRKSLPPPVVDAIFDAGLVPSVVVDFSSSPALVVRANAALRSVCGGAVVPGTPLTDVFADAEACLQLLADGRARGSIDTTCLVEGGGQVLVTIQVNLLSTGERQRRLALLQISSSHRGLDVELALRESERRLEEMADNVNASMYLKRSDGRYILINRCFEQEFGVRREDVNGRLADFVSPEIAAAYRENDLRVLASGRPMQFEEPRPGGGVYLSVKFPVRDENGKPYAVGGISSDITERNRAELAIRAARDEAERANRAKSEFLSRMSHELRTPLNSILGFGQLLRMQNPKNDVHDKADRILQAGRHLLMLINDVLEISRIEQGDLQVSREPVRAVEPLIEALDLVRPLAGARGIEIAQDLHEGLYAHVLADHHRLKQVLLNVLGNAIKYNKEEGIVTVSFSSPTTGRLRYRITDTGVGMDPGDVEKIFAPFQRLHHDEVDLEGTGLGLALSKELIAIMGGTIGVEATKRGRGSTFFIELPIIDAPAKDMTAVTLDCVVEPTPECADDVSILYIEDNLSNIELMQEVLEQTGKIHLILAHRGQDGIELARRHQPDLILLDLHLPRESGEDVLLELRGDERTRDIPVVILSADAVPAQMTRLKDAGATEYLTKPIDIPLVIKTIRSIVDQEKSQARSHKPGNDLQG